jgi:Zn-finger nucleic acid-binding protein
LAGVPPLELPQDASATAMPDTDARRSACPACAETMRVLSIPYAPSRPMAIDSCEPCRGLWFDTGEHIRMSAEGTLALVRHLAAAPQAERRRLPLTLSCPVCGDRLGPTYDLVGETQYRYFRCPGKHGFFISVFDFLRSRGLLRGLSPIEADALRRKVAAVNCSGCGAPVSLEGDRTCSYCQAPLSVIDTDHLKAAIAQLEHDAAAERLPRRARRVVPADDVVNEWRRSRERKDEDEPQMLWGRRQRIDLLDVGAAVLGWLMK